MPTPSPTATPSPTPTPTPTPSPTPPPAPIPASPLHVQGNQLLNAAGQAVQIHGVNRSGAEFACAQGWGIFGTPVDQASVDAMRSWNVNAVRIGLNENCWLALGTPAAYSGVVYQQAIKDYVQELNQNGLFAVITVQWQGTSPNMDAHQPMPDENAPQLWTEVAKAFKGNDAVILELFSEPWPDDNHDTAAAWTCLRDGGTCPPVAYQTVGMQRLVDTVRLTGATNVIGVPGTQFANTLTQWLAYEPHDPLSNLVATWHVFNSQLCLTVSCYDETAGVVAAQVPIVATEIGNDACDASWLNTLMSWLDAKQAGYLAWVWEPWGPDCSTGALITDPSGSPTTTGHIYRTHIAGRS
jgi:endoglucanase